MQRPEEVPLSPKMVYYRSLFDKFDQNEDGKINVQELRDFLNKSDYEEHDFAPKLVRRVHQIADKNRDGYIDFEEFVAMMHNPKLKRYFRKYLDIYMEAMVPPSTRDRGYASQYTWCPPPVGMIAISLVEVVFFLIDYCRGYDTRYTSGPLGTVFIFDPLKREQVWRFLTYMFVHAGVTHLVLNVLVQIVLAVPLEMVHRWWRILVIYTAGVLSGSLLSSITNPMVRLAGASGGTYSVLTAHLSTIIMNWSEMPYKYFHLLGIVGIIVTDVGTAVYENFALGMKTNIGYAAHLGGASAGLLVGINVLRNLRKTELENKIWWISIVLFSCLFSLGILLNIFWTSHFPHADDFY